jgi:hypothetical protein
MLRDTFQGTPQKGTPISTRPSRTGARSPSPPRYTVWPSRLFARAVARASNCGGAPKAAHADALAADRFAGTPSQCWVWRKRTKCCSGTVGTPFAKRGLRCHYKSVTFKGYPGSIGRASLADPTVIPGPPQERLAWHHLAGRSQERCSRGNSDQIVSCWMIRSQPCRGGEQQKECDDETSFCSGVSRCLCRRIYSQLCTRRLCTRCWLCPRIWSWRLCARSYDSFWEPRAADTHL